eukprot:6485291-Amphidinium_carterae.1
MPGDAEKSNMVADLLGHEVVRRTVQVPSSTSEALRKPPPGTDPRNPQISKSLKKCQNSPKKAGVFAKRGASPFGQGIRSDACVSDVHGLVCGSLHAHLARAL